MTNMIKNIWFFNIDKEGSYECFKRITFGGNPFFWLIRILLMNSMGWMVIVVWWGCLFESWFYYENFKPLEKVIGQLDQKLQRINHRINERRELFSG